MIMLLWNVITILLKNKLINHHYYHSEKELYTSIEEFMYVHYNHERPHSYNNYKTPFEGTLWGINPVAIKN